jgi:hypothetical protein
MDEKTIEKAGRIMKLLRMAREPGHDHVSIKLNSGLTYEEKRAAQRWARCFELAEKAGETYSGLCDAAVELDQEFKY